MVSVFFCTNRNPISTSIPNNFGTDFNPSPSVNTFGRAEVRSIRREGDLSDQNISVGDLTSNAFSADIHETICSGADHLLISIHGFDYRFREAVMRTAWLMDWFKRGTPPIRTNAVLFSWPSLGSQTPEAYEADWQRARASSGAFRLFFRALVPLLQDFRSRKSRRRVSLMAHSMGNHALASGLGATIGSAPGQFPLEGAPLFDRVLLVAADEDNDALSRPERLAPLRQLAERTYVYYNNQDLPLSTVSRILHGTSRLGVNGPPDKGSFRGLNYTFINCSAANPGTNDDPTDPQGHQYYRLVPEVRDDICGVFSGGADETLPNRTLREGENYYRLDCKPSERPERFFP
jgi:esterase/lipase superfamily enzyme